MKPVLTSHKKKIYEKIIEEATMDCYNEDEQTSGWECVLDEKIAAPCPCKIGEQEAMLEKVCMVNNTRAVIGIVKLNNIKMRVLIQDIFLDDIEAMKYINAYAYWCEEG